VTRYAVKIHWDCATSTENAFVIVGSAMLTTIPSMTAIATAAMMMIRIITGLLPAALPRQSASWYISLKNDKPRTYCKDFSRQEKTIHCSRRPGGDLIPDCRNYPRSLPLRSAT